MRIIGGGAKAATGAAALAAALVPALAAAQTLPDFSIPGARPTSNPRSQGPVDADNPVVRAPVVRPTPAPSPVPVASPTPVPSAPTATTSPPPTSRNAPTRAAPRPVATAAPQSSPSTAPAPVVADPVTTVPLPGSSSLPAIPPTGSVIQPAPADGASGSYWPWIVGGIAALAALLAGVWWRRRRQQPAPLEFITPVVPAPAPAPQPQPKAPIAPAARTPLPTPQLAAAPQGLGISLEAKRMSASLMATTLSYALTLTNHSREMLSALAVEGDMIAAHASLPPDQQIASGAQRLELRHALVTLGPGESAQFTGDFRLPLNALNPIRAGDAAYFVPLARLRVEASTPAGAPLVQVRTFVVGEIGEDPAAGLRPFRLDLGPRTYSRIGQRAVN